jgi:hypothetical protein
VALFTLAVQDGVPVPLPAPPKGYGDTPDRIGSEQIMMAGSRIRQTTAIKQTWVFGYRWLTDAQYADLRLWVDPRLAGWRGLGPFELRRFGDAAVYLVNVGLAGAVVPLVGWRHAEFSMVEV